MPRRIQVDEHTLDYLWDAVDAGHSYKRMSDEVGCCVDTLKRILHRNGIVKFEGAKYTTPISEDIIMWNRPCSRCGSEESRPKNQYRCDACKARVEHNESLPDEWI